MYETRANGRVGATLGSWNVSRLSPFMNGVAGAFMSFMCSSITDKVSLMTGDATAVESSLAVDMAGSKDVRNAICAIGDAELCEGPEALAGRCSVDAIGNRDC
jgi:hypothetical protein